MTTILFLAANPENIASGRLDEEIREITERMRLTSVRDHFEIQQQWATRVRDLTDALLRYKPDIVHFAVMGTTSGEIVLEGRDGKPQPVPAKALGELFLIVKDKVRCVVINAPHAKTQVKEIAKHIDCVIGISEMLNNKAAICFAAGFYQTLGFGRTIKTAYDLACAELKLEGIDDGTKPIMISRNCDCDLVGPNRATLLDSVILNRLSEGGSNKRSEAARQLGYLKDSAGVPILETRWPLEPDPTVRYWLAIAIGWIGGSRATDTLFRLEKGEEDLFAKSGITEAVEVARSHS